MKNIFIDLKIVSKKLKDLSKDKSIIWEIVKNQIVDILKESNPENYKIIMHKNEYIIFSIINEITDKYCQIINKEIEQFCKFVNKDENQKSK